MSEAYSRDDVFAYLDAWKCSLDTRTALYTRFMAGSLSGIILIVAPIGLSLEQISELGWGQKSLLSASLLLLIFCLGNILNCWRFMVNTGLELEEIRRRLILDRTAEMSGDDMQKLHQELIEKRAVGHEHYPHAYWCFVLAVLLGVVGFFWIIWSF